MAGLGDTTWNRSRAKCVALRERLRRSWAWRHKTKVVGTGISVGAYLQNNLANVGKGLSAEHFAQVVGAAGAVVFVLGFVNIFLPADPP